MSLREDLQAAWRLARDEARHGHGLCPYARRSDCAPLDLHYPVADDQSVRRQRAAAAFIRAAAREVGDALFLGAVLVRFFAVIVPLIARHYVRRLWHGGLRIGGHHRSDIGAAATRGRLPSRGGLLGIPKHDQG